MKYRGRLSTAEEFGELVVKSLPGGDVLRLKEVADIELGDEYYNYSSEVNGHPAAMMMINQKSGSNASSTINEIHEVLDDLSRDLPEGAEFCGAYRHQQVPECLHPFCTSGRFIERYF